MAYGTFSPVTLYFNICIKCSEGFHCKVFFSLSHLAERVQGALGKGKHRAPRIRNGEALPFPQEAPCAPSGLLSLCPVTPPLSRLGLVLLLFPWPGKSTPEVLLRPSKHPLLQGCISSIPVWAPQARPPAQPLTLPSSGLCWCMGRLPASHPHSPLGPAQSYPHNPLSGSGPWAITCPSRPLPALTHPAAVLLPLHHKSGDCPPKRVAPDGVCGAMLPDQVLKQPKCPVPL